MQSGKLYLCERAFHHHDSVSVSIVGCLYAVRDLFVLERLNLFEFRRDGVIFVVVFAEEQYDRLASGNDFVCFGNVNVVVNGQNVDVCLCGGIRRQREENFAFLRSVFCIPSVEGFPCYVFFFYGHAWRDDRDGVYGGCVHIGLLK